MAQIGGAAARGVGPLNLLLSNSGAQWVTILGLGAYVINPDSFVKAIRTIAGDETYSTHNNKGNMNNSNLDRASPIIIHTGSENRNGSSLTVASFVSTLIFYTIGAGCVWVSYTLCTTMLPDYISEFMPVTRKVFDQTTKNLATSLFNVKEAMIKQIHFVMSKQDELGKKQDETHLDVKDIQEDMKFVRTDLSGVMDGVDRCEATVEASQRLQAYTARGVKLLVAAVATVLPRDDNPHILRELEKYARDGEQFRQMIDRSSSSPTQQIPLPPNSQYLSQVTTVVNEPPENEHPRQQQQYPMYALSSSQKSPTNTYIDQSEQQQQLDFLAMIRDGTIVVQRP
jgi:hypothetical protein